MTGRRAWLLVTALALVGSAAPLVEAGPHLVDGLGADWSVEELIAGGVRPPTESNVTIDLTTMSAADNGTSWFFRLSFLWQKPGENASMALYLFGPDDGAGGQAEPLGYGVLLPSGATLHYVLYIELDSAFPTSSKAVFNDGVAWKNRTFAELGVSAARNDSAGFVELSAARDSFTFLEAGSAAAAVLSPPGGAARHMVDGLPESAAAPPGTLASRARFFDYTFQPPVAFSAIGLSDPLARNGDNVTIFVELTNQGPRNLSGLSAQVSIDGVALAAQDGLTLLGGGTAVVSFAWQAAGGEHNVTARSFPGGATRSLHLALPSASADLVLLKVTVEPPTPAPGQAFSVAVDVENTGTAPSQGGRLLLKDGTLVLASSPIPPVEAGGSARVSLQARIARSGPVTLRVEIDGANGANSTQTTEILVQAPSPPFGLSPPVLIGLALGAVAAAAWTLTPRLARRGGGGKGP